MIPMLLRRKRRAKLAPALRPKPEPEPEAMPKPEPECEPGAEREPGTKPVPRAQSKPKLDSPTPAPEMELAQPGCPVAQWKMVMILAVYTIAVLATFVPVSGDLADCSLHRQSAQRNRPQRQTGSSLASNAATTPARR